MLDPTNPATTIVVGIDGSPRSEDAVSFAGRLAGATGTSLTLVRAYPYVPLGTWMEDPARAAELRVDAEMSLERMRQLIPSVTDVTLLAVADPSPARAIHQLAAQRRAVLIVIGSSHVGRLGRVVPGSTGERLLHGAPCPVMIVPRGLRQHEGGAVGPIGVAYDGSPESKVALGAAIAAARALHAPLHLVGVCDVGRYRAPALQYGPGYYVSPDTVRDDAAIELAAGVATVPDDVEAERVLLFGNPARELVDVSSRLGMLFVGSRGYGPLRAVLLGGVGGALVREAACPVIVTARGATVDADTTTAAATAIR